MFFEKEYEKKSNSYGWLYTGMIFAVQHQINTTATMLYDIILEPSSLILLLYTFISFESSWYKKKLSIRIIIPGIFHLLLCLLIFGASKTKLTTTTISMS